MAYQVLQDLSVRIGSHAIVAANREVEAELGGSQETTRIHSSYNRYNINYTLIVSLFTSFLLILFSYTSSQRAKMGKYASLHGVTAAAQVFSRKLRKSVSESTVRSIRDVS